MLKCFSFKCLVYWLKCNWMNVYKPISLWFLLLQYFPSLFPLPYTKVTPPLSLMLLSILTVFKPHKKVVMSVHHRWSVWLKKQNYTTQAKRMFAILWANLNQSCFHVFNFGIIGQTNISKVQTILRLDSNIESKSPN